MIGEALGIVEYLDKWTEDELIERRNHIAKLAVQIWKYPETAFVPPIKEDDVICLNDEFNLTYRNIKFLTFMGTMYQTNSWGHAVEIITKLLFELDPDIMYRESLNGDNLYIVTKPENNRTKKIAEHIARLIAAAIHVLRLLSLQG